MKKLLIILFACLLTESTWANHWTPQSSAYSEVMALTSVIQIDGIEQYSDQLEVGVFCGNECRGSQMAIEFEITNRFLVQLTIYGENGHELTFKLYDHSIGEELNLASPDAITFNSNGIGQPISPINPYVLDFTSNTTQNTSSGLWSNPSIWYNNSVPGAYSSVVIANDCVIDMDVLVSSLTILDGCVLTVLSGNTLTVIGDLVNDNINGFIIEDGAQVINASPNVKATVEKDVMAYTAKDSNGWYLISSSVNDMLIAGSDFLTETYDLYRYNESSTTWENYRGGGHADFTTFEKGRGYLYANSNGISPAFVGTLNNAAVTYQVTAAAAATTSRGINIIGNPFPHNIYKGTGGAIDDSNLESGYYELTYAGAWIAHSFDDPILPGQGVLVVAKSNANVTIAKTNAEATAETSSKGSVKRLKINVSGNGSEDRAYAYFSEGEGLDKLDNFSSSAAQISILNGGDNYAIAHMGADCEMMDVIFKNTKNADYTITLEGIEDFSYLHLIDNLTGADTDMLIEKDYKFHANGNEYAERFKIICRDCTGIGENAETSMFAYVNNGNVVVNGEGTLQLIDMTGRIINTVEINGTQMIEKPSCGVYVLRMISGNEVKTQKIVVK